MNSLEKTIHVFKIYKKENLFVANCSSLLGNGILTADTKEVLEENIKYSVKNIIMREHLKKIVYYIEDI